LPPTLEVDLIPLRVFIELHVQSSEFQLVIFRLQLVLGEIDDGVVFLNFEEHPFAVSRDLIAIYITQDSLFPVLHAINAKMRFPIAPILIVFVVRGIVSDGPAEIENAIIHHSNIAVVARNNFDAGNTIVNTININLNYDRLLFYLTDLGSH